MLAVYALLFSLLLLTASPVQAGLRLQLEQQQLTAEQLQASQQLLDEVLTVLPPRMVEQLDQTVPVSWSQRLPDNVMGRASPGGKITLNQRWLSDLLSASDTPNIAGRQHPTLRSELKATLIHELAHLYDQGRFWLNDERRLLQYCRSRERVQGHIGLPSECRGQSNRQFTLSDAPRWLDLAGWQQQVGKRGRRDADNFQQLRSPDTYELHNPQEFVAVNLEYFLLDPQYACRRPALADYLQAHFSWAPAHSQPCATELPYLNASLDSSQPALAWLDPERIYQVHYLLAEPDASWAGRWGHSMLRLVICAPGRTPGPDCLLDLEHHLVLSFRAFVDDVQLSSWDGLMGNYPSRLFLLPLQKVVDEYTQLELRGLSSVPLRLDAQARQRLAQQATALHWSYDGTYYFVSNNCAVETLKLLRSGSALPQLQSLDSQTPTGLLALLDARGLADLQPLQDHQAALRQGYYFDSYRERYNHMFEVLRRQLQIPFARLEDWLSSPASDRQTWFAAANTRSTAALLVLEEAIQRRHVLDIQQDLKLRFLSKDAPAELTEAAQLMQGLLSSSSFLSRPGELLSEGYGLPQPQESQQFFKIATARQQMLLTSAEDLEQRLLSLMSAEQRQQLDATGANINMLSRQLRQLHSESGSIQLP